MIYERTIRNPAECSGVGLHSGAPVHLRILPAPTGTGIVFRRTDLDGFEVEAVSRNVAKVSYATSLMKKGVLISTITHLLSACVGMGVDNAIVELDNVEVPILDGSALPFVEMIANAGLRQQRRRRVYLKILRPYEMQDGDKFIGIYPSERYSVSYAIDFPHPLIGSERFQVELSNDAYVREIAPARTFRFLDQQREMLNMGLIRGASRENGIVLTSEGIDNPPLRYPDEFVRHQVLELIGDLALFGKRILGYVKADRAGRAMHAAIVSRILRDQTYAEEIALSEASVADWPTESEDLVMSDAMPAEGSDRAIRDTKPASSVSEDFTVTFDPHLPPEAIRATLSALADYYRACGGIGLSIGDFEFVGAAAEELVRV